MQYGNEIEPVYAILQNIFLSKNSTKNVAWELVPGPFNFHRILCNLDKF